MHQYKNCNAPIFPICKVTLFSSFTPMFFLKRLKTHVRHWFFEEKMSKIW